MTFLPLYIDPGTGSMMFSVFIGTITTAYFLVRAAFLKIQILFSGRKAREAAKGGIKKYVIYCEGKQYWNVFKPVTDEFEKRKIILTYFTSAKDDPIFGESYEYIKPEFIGEGNVAYARLNMLTADIVLMTTPGLDVYQLKRSRNVKHYAHVRHGAGDATMYRLFGLDYFDSVLLTGDYQKEDIRTLEKQRNINQKELVTVGCTYLDELASHMADIPQETDAPFTVLVSPSWGPSAILSRYGEKLLDPLVKTGWRIIVRPHPQSKKSETAIVDYLMKKYRETSNLEWDYERDNIFAMKKADIMISDFSSIIYDYIFLCDKPVMYVNADLDLRMYDAGEIPDKRLWQFTTLEKIGIELKEEQFPHIAEMIKKAGDSTELAAARERAKTEAWQHIGTAGVNIADFMIAKENELIETSLKKGVKK